jgi:hypothetical protein
VDLSILLRESARFLVGSSSWDAAATCLKSNASNAHIVLAFNTQSMISTFGFPVNVSHTVFPFESSTRVTSFVSFAFWSNTVVNSGLKVYITESIFFPSVVRIVDGVHERYVSWNA